MRNLVMWTNLTLWMKLHKIDEIAHEDFKLNPFTSFMSYIQEIGWNKMKFTNGWKWDKLMISEHLCINEGSLIILFCLSCWYPLKHNAQMHFEECMKLLTNWLYQWKMMRLNTWAKWDHMDEIWSHGIIWLCGCNLMTLLKLCHQLDYVVELDGINEIGHEDEIQIYVDGIGPYNWTAFTWMHVNEIDDIHGHNFFSWMKERTQNALNHMDETWKQTMKLCLLVMGIFEFFYIHYL